jgi:hypothetical protein
MKRAKRGFGSVRIVLLGGMVALGSLSLTACGGNSGSAATASTGSSSQTGSVSSGGSVVSTPSDGGSQTGTVSNGSTGSSPAAKTVNLQWQAPTENSDGTPLTDLKGYKIHYGTESQTYTGEISVDNPTVTTFLVDTLGAGKYYFAVGAYNRSGAESPLSDEVTATFN